MLVAWCVCTLVSEYILLQSICDRMPVSFAQLVLRYHYNLCDPLRAADFMEVNNKGIVSINPDKETHQFVTVASDGQMLFWDLRQGDLGSCSHSMFLVCLSVCLSVDLPMMHSNPGMVQRTLNNGSLTRIFSILLETLVYGFKITKSPRIALQMRILPPLISEDNNLTCVNQRVNRTSKHTIAHGTHATDL